MAVKVFAKDFVAGDVWIRDDLSREFTAEQGKLTNAGAFPIHARAGQPITVAAGVITILASANLAAATVAGYLVNTTMIGIGETKNLAYFAATAAVPTRGAGIVANEMAYPTDASSEAGTAYLAGELKTKMLAAGIVVRSVPTAAMTAEQVK